MEKRSDFEWDSAKDELNQKKHGVLDIPVKKATLSGGWCQ
jgi:uncharacterized DUF497 family protein